MSTEPQALDRAVLERKERDELAAIADAMGVKTTARASKASLVDSILREAGVEVSAEGNGAAADKPRRPRGRPKATADDDGTPASPVVDAAPLVEAEPEADRANGAAEPVATAPTAEGGEPRSADPAPTTTTTTTTTTDPEAATAPAEAPAAPQAEAAAAPAPTAPTTQTQPPPTERRDRDDRPPRDRGERGDRGPQQQQGQQQGRPDGGNAGEPGNRRSRRRRGRDRSERPGPDRGERGERDIQGGGDQPYHGELVPIEGLLDLSDQGYGFLRTAGYLPSAKDIYVSLSQVRRFALRKGDYLQGASRPANTTEKYPALVRIDTVNDMSPDEARNRPKFEELTPLFPDEKMRLEVPGDAANMVARIVDLISPIGKGQRGLIVSPPKAGKTTVLKQIAHSIEANNPEVHLIVLLVDERPEEVTDMRRSVAGEVVASTFDRPSDEHTQVAELTIERAKRLVEMGRDVVIVLDGITRLARAYNLAAPASGRILSGGVDSAALYPPKRFFGSARNIEEGGSLTILATALIETGSRMDEVIFEEFKGTGNMELRLDRKLAERRIYPAIDVDGSSTRHEELLFDRNQLKQVWKLRRVLSGLSEGGAGLELLMDKIKTTKSNDEFLAEIAKAPTPTG